MLKQHHHIWLNSQFVADCQTWKVFLQQDQYYSLCQPFVDFSEKSMTSTVLGMYSDASKNLKYGMGAVFLEENSWIVLQWNPHFIIEQYPSIEFLELYALTCAVLTWGRKDRMRNRRVTIFCDNEAVVFMVNSYTSTCMQCCKFIRIQTVETKYCKKPISIIQGISIYPTSLK